MGKKSADNLLKAIEKSKDQGLDKLLFALGIRHIGSKGGRLLALQYKTMDALMEASAEELAAIKDIGAVIAESVVTWFANPLNRELIDRLKRAGLNMEMQVQAVNESHPFYGKTLVFTGTMPTLDRATAQTMAQAGSKLEKARSLGVTVIDEAEFLRMLGEKSEAAGGEAAETDDVQETVTEVPIGTKQKNVSLEKTNLSGQKENPPEVEEGNLFADLEEEDS